MGNSDKILEKIKKEELKPIPKKYFLIKNGFLWGLFILGVIIGALAFSVVLFSIQQTDFELAVHMSHSKLEMLLGLLPFIWIFFLVGFLVLAIIGIRNSRRGYKFTIGKMVGISTALSILLGTAFFIGGGAKKLEKAFAVNVSIYESIDEKKMKMWTMPEEGYLSGIIESVGGDTLILLDFNNKKWVVPISSAIIPHAEVMEKGEKVKLVGKKNATTVFFAEEILPWGGRRRRMNRIK